MTKALVLGATGGIGGAAARALIAAGWQVRALARGPDAAARWQGTAPEWHVGDAMVREDVERAADGVSVIVHAVNPKGYRGWDRLVLPMIDNTIAAATAAGARIVLPGTVYNYDPAATPLVVAATPQHPTTRKGAVRVALERRLEVAAAAGVPSLILRAGDFLGPAAGQSWFSQAFVQQGRPVRRIVDPGRRGIGHSWAYLPDLAEAMVRLLAVVDRLERFERVQFACIWDPDGRQLIDAIRRVVGRPDLRVWPFPWWLLPAAALVSETAREMIEVKPFWRSPMRFDNDRLVALIGQEPHTPLDAAVAATLRGLGCLDGPVTAP